LQHVGIGFRIQQQSGRANPRQFLLLGANAAIGGQLIVHFRARFRITGCNFAGRTQTRQHAVAGGSGGRDLVESRFGFRVLGLLDKLDRGVKSGARLGGLLGFQILVASPAGDGGNDQNGGRDDLERVLVPELLELLPADFLVDFIK
jgi:hypothetical protein